MALICVDHRVEPVAAPAHDVQHRAEDLAPRAGRCRSSSKARGAKKLPCVGARRAAAARSASPRASCAPMCVRALARASSSITGPTSVASSAGSPIASSRIAPAQHLDDAVGDVVLHDTAARSAEQRWPARAEGALHARRRPPARAAPSCRRSSRSGRRSRRSAARSAPSLARQRAVDGRAVSVEPVKRDAGDARVGDQRRADGLAVAGQQRQRVGRARPPRAAARPRARRPAASARPAWRRRRCRRRARPRPGRRRSPAGSSTALMQTKTPRPCSASLLLSPVGPGKFARRSESRARAAALIAAEVHRLAQFGDAVGKGLAALAGQQEQEFLA